MMRTPNAVFFLMISSLPVAAAMGQSPAANPPAPAAPGQATLAQGAAAGPGSALQPAIISVEQTIAAVKVEKWKRGSVRDEAGDHVGVLLRDLRDTMPPLVTAADATPNTVSAQLPLSRNVDAVYDILLSVVEAARVSGPPAQVTDLDQALRSLNTARVTFDEHLQQISEAAEKQITALQATVKAQAAVKCPVQPPPVVPVCPAPPPVKKPVHRKPKPPAATAPGTTAPGTTTPGTTVAPAKPSM
jgi:hypothetical protein